MSGTSGPPQSDLSGVPSAAPESELGKREREPDKSTEPESTEQELKRLRLDNAAMRQQLDETRTSRAIGSIVHGGLSAVMHGGAAFGSALHTFLRTVRTAAMSAFQNELRTVLFPDASADATTPV